MNRPNMYRRVAGPVCLLLAAGCGCASPGPQNTPDRSAGRRTVAVLYFNDHSAADDAAHDKWKKLIADLLITHLASVPDLIVVARTRLEDVLAELELGSSDLRERDTQLQLSTMLGAGSIVVGDYVAVGPILRLDARVVDVETGRMVHCAEVTGPARHMFRLIWTLAATLSSEFGPALPEAPGASAAGVSVATSYARGLNLLDAGDLEGARAAFTEVLDADPGNAGAHARIEQIEQLD